MITEEAFSGLRSGQAAGAGGSLPKSPLGIASLRRRSRIRPLELPLEISHWRLVQFIHYGVHDGRERGETTSRALFAPSRQLLSAFRAGLASLRSHASDLVGPDEGFVPDVAEVPDDVLGRLVASQVLRLMSVVAKHASYSGRGEVRLSDSEGFVSSFDKLVSDRLAVAPKTYPALSSQLFQDLRLHLMLRRSIVVGDAELIWDQGGIVLRVPPAESVEVAPRRSHVAFG